MGMLRPRTPPDARRYFRLLISRYAIYLPLPGPPDFTRFMYTSGRGGAIVGDRFLSCVEVEMSLHYLGIEKSYASNAFWILRPIWRVKTVA